MGRMGGVRKSGYGAWRMACKPSSVPGLRPATVIHLTRSVARSLVRPTRGLSEQPAAARTPPCALLFGLAPARACRVSLLRFHAGIVTVALVLASRRTGVTREPALWSSDFPQAPMVPATVRPSPGTLDRSTATDARPGAPRIGNGAAEVTRVIDRRRRGDAVTPDDPVRGGWRPARRPSVEGRPGRRSVHPRTGRPACAGRRARGGARSCCRGSRN